jgi:hypothetical protein
MKKFIVKTTKEYTYDNQGRIAKEIITEESYEQELSSVTHSGVATAIPSNPYIYTAKGVPNKVVFHGDGGVTLKGNLRVDEGKADANGITHNHITVNANLPKNVGDIMDEVKATLNKAIIQNKGKLF